MIDEDKKLIFVHIPKTAGSSITNIINTDSKLSGRERINKKHFTIQDYCNDVDKDIFENYFKFSVVRNPWDRFVSIYNFFGLVLGENNHYRNFAWERIKNPIPDNLLIRINRGHLPKADRMRWLDKSNYKLLNFEEFTYKFKDTFFDKNKEYKLSLSENAIESLNWPNWTKTQIDFLSIDNKIVVDNLCKFENLQEDFNKICKKINLSYSKSLPHVLENKHSHYTEMHTDTTKKIIEEIYGEEIEHFKYTFK